MKALGLALLLGLVVGCGAQRVQPTTETSPTTEMPVQKEATYWVTFNTKVRPGQTMSFNVLIIKGISNVTVKASLLDSTGERGIAHSSETICSPGEVQVIPIEIPLDVEKPSPRRWDNYQVRVVGVGEEVKFKEKGYATLQEKAFSTFIQTDKAMYKPKQEVKFRVVSMDPQMQVIKDAIYDIVVKDAKNNRVFHLRDVDASQQLGVVQSSIRLADNIPTGDWKIEATVMGFTETKTVTVSDYVLPKFEVEIDAPEFGISNDTHLTFTVKAKYTFGKPVSESRVVIEIIHASYKWYNVPEIGENPRVIRLDETLNRDGQYQGSIPLRSLIRLFKADNSRKEDIEWQRFIINATVEEARTKKKQSAEHELQYYSTPITMKFLPITPKSYKQGMDFTAYLEVRQRDDSLVPPEKASEIKIRFNVTYEMKRTIMKESPTTPPTEFSDGTVTNTDGGIADQSAMAERAVLPNFYVPTITKVLTLPEDVRVQTLPDNGWLVIRFEIPSSATSFNIHAESDAPYKRTDHAYFYGNPANSPSDSFLQLNVTNHKPKVNDKVHVKAKATEPMQALNYQLSAKGILLQSKRVTPSSPSKEIELEFLVESTMSPNLNLLAFFVKEDGEFVVDALSLSVEGLFANSVDLKFSKEKVKPGENVDLIVKAQENSMVFLLAVDKSVKLLKSGNDITQELVRQELLKYEGGNNYGYWRYMFICGWPSYNSGSDAASVFSSAGVQVLTDGLVYREPYHTGRPDIFYFMSGRGGIVQDAMPMASQPRSGSSGSTLKTKTRTIFPENWLWNAWRMSSNGEERINLTAPDTITSWVASAFSSHPTHGLSVGAEPAEVITFKDLFLSLDLPSFLVRDEYFCFTASVFHYYNETVSVWTTMEQSSDFSGIYTKKGNRDELIFKTEKARFNTVFGSMKEGDIKSTDYCFTPENLGIITIRVSVHTNVSGLGDAVEHKLRVKPEGVPRSTTIPYLISLQNGQWNRNVAIVFPPRTVPGSEKVTIKVAGNLLASVFENIDNLVRQPYGCGEQNMINFAPLISLLEFFTVSNKLTPEIESKILNFMSQGYQRELNYEHGESGGYSAFGDGGHDGPSTWLTAFVLKCFAQAHQLDTPFTELDVISRSALWLSKHNRRGAFVENGKVFNKRLQGGSGSDKALTAYSVIALHEAAKALGENSSAYQNVIYSRNRGISYLEATHAQLNDPYDVCITAYALHFVDSKEKDAIFDKMESLAITSPGLKHWERAEVKPTHTYYWTKATTALSIEMTSYALCTYIKRGNVTTKGLDIINWLSQQKNANGGFISTQDTVIGIEAMANFLTEAKYVPMNVTVTSGSDTKTFDMKEENEMLLQMFEVPHGSITNGVSLQAITKDPIQTATTVLVEVAQDFNVEDKSESDVYQLQYNVVNGIVGPILHLTLSTINNETVSMTMVEIDVPSDYGIEDEKVITELNLMVSKTEWRKADMIALYLHTDTVGPRPVTIQVPFEETGGGMTNSKPKNIRIYNYYEPDTTELVVSFTFPGNERNLCDLAKEFGRCYYVQQLYEGDCSRDNLPSVLPVLTFPASFYEVDRVIIRN